MNFNLIPIQDKWNVMFW